jgi:alpha,alpha-trehalase
MNLPVTIDARAYDAVIFGLDGVVIDIMAVHARAWATLFDEFLRKRPLHPSEHHGSFTHDDYLHFMDGKPPHDAVADFLFARGISLRSGAPSDSDDDTVCGLVNRQQQLFRQLLGDVPVFEATITLVRKLQSVGIGTGVFSPSLDCGHVLRAAGLDDLFNVVVDGIASVPHRFRGKPDRSALAEAVFRLGAPAERVVVVDSSETAVDGARNAGLGLVIGVDRIGHADELLRCGADVVVCDLADVDVVIDLRRMSALPNALDSYGQLTGVVRFRPLMVFVDFDGTLSPITPDPEAATLVYGAAEALKHLAEQCPVAVLSDRDLDDVRSRVNLPGIWYAGSHGLELMAPDGAYHKNERGCAVIPVIERAAAQLRATLAHVPGILVEHKRFAVAVHYRDVPPEHIGEVIASTRRLGQWEDLRVISGRKRVELRPDIESDTGTTVSWIRDQVKGQHGVLPMYIGDDLTDEAAFDAVRLDGIGIVVRHSEHGDRQTAAKFILESPEQVREFLERGAKWLAYERATSREAWTLTYDDYEPQKEKLREALCTVGNGYFATRGAASESKAGQVHYPGTYAAGVYNRLADEVSGRRIENESLVNLPNWLPLTFRVDDGEWFDIDAVTILAYRQTLDLLHAVLTREVRFRDAVGRTTSLTQRRFVAMHLAHVGALQETIVAEDWSGTLEIRSTIDGHVRNSLVERYRDLSSRHLEYYLESRQLSENSVLVSTRTTQSRVPIAIAARTVVWRNDSGVPATYQFIDEETGVGHVIAVDVSAGDSVTVEKTVTLFTGRDVATSEPAVNAAIWLNRLEGFSALREGHQTAWEHLWERMSIEFEGYAEHLKVTRLHLMHLLQTVSLNCADLDVGVPARGLHGEAYRGLVFWDELFIFPVLNFRFPMITRSLLRYRYRRLPEARHAAKDAGYAGAMFPWQSGSSGREECQRMHLNPKSGRWNPDASALAHHVGLAVAYNVWQYYQATADLAFLIDYGAEMLIEIARFWVSRTEYDEDRERYVIRGVIGPDEFHSGYPDAPHKGIDNNAYTNVMAVWAILRALDALELLPTPNRLDVMEKLALDRVELAQWRVVSRRMFVPFHDELISQFEGYEKLAELDWDAYRKQYGDIHRLDRILEAEGDDVNRYKASKQADVLMLFYLLSSSQLSNVLQRLGYRLKPGHISRMVDYYIARTSHGSTLSAVVHSWVLARANRDRAMEFFRQVLSSDVDDVQGGTTSEGIHLAAMAGSVDLVQRCFTGLVFRRDRIVLSPNWPESLGTLGFPIHYRGMHLHLRVSGRGAEISVDPREAPPVEIECRGRVRLLTPGSMLRFA